MKWEIGIVEENRLAWFLVAVMIVLYMTGCVAQRDRHIPVQPFTLHLVTDMTSNGFAGYKGYCHDRDIWVKWDGDRPDFETLGHEVWHLQECGGAWHGPWNCQ